MRAFILPLSGYDDIDAAEPLGAWLRELVEGPHASRTVVAAPAFLAAEREIAA